MQEWQLFSPKVTFTDGMKQRASARVDKALLRQSYGQDKQCFGKDPDRIYRGFLGEEMVKRYYDIQTYDEVDYSTDIIIHGKPFDVKTSNCWWDGPKSSVGNRIESYDSRAFKTIAAENYIFALIYQAGDYGFIKGWVPGAEFKEKAVMKPAGTWITPKWQLKKDTCMMDNEFLHDIRELNETMPKEMEGRSYEEQERFCMLVEGGTKDRDALLIMGIKPLPKIRQECLL